MVLAAMISIVLIHAFAEKHGAMGSRAMARFAGLTPYAERLVKNVR